MSTRQLPKELQEKAENELNETADRKEDDIKHIKEWLKKQPHLNTRTDDQWLLNFLRCSKFSVQRAKERLDFFYTIRTLAPEFFGDRDPMLPEIQDIIKRGVIVPFSNPIGPAGPLLVVIRWAKGDPEKNSYVNLVKVLLMVIDILLNENDNFSVAGALALEDFADFPFNYVAQLTPSLCKKTMLSVESACPIRIKGIYCINTPSYFETIYNLFKPFLKDKLKERIKIFGKGDYSNLHQNILKSALPNEYGGQAGYIDDVAAEWKTKIESYRDWFLEDARYFSIETKRPGTPKTCVDVFGMDGSFRKLGID